MKNIKKNERNKDSNTMLDQKQGSMLDKKTNEDFNNEHPDHDEDGLINIPTKNSEEEGKQTSKMKMPKKKK